MSIFRTIISKYQKAAQERDLACDDLIVRIDDALRDANSLFTFPMDFVDPQEATAWKQRNRNVIHDSDTYDTLWMKTAKRYRILSDKQLQLSKLSQTLLQQILQYNEEIARIKVQDAYALIGDIEGHTLDQQQMTCIVKEAHNHLVIAGAGTGKTTTVIGKIKYLLKTGQYLPKDILVLSFTNASAAEMKSRITDETGHILAVSTFHKLGLNIISQVTGLVPKITKLQLRTFIKEQLALHMQSDTYLNLLSTYLLYNHVVAKSEFDFTTKQEYEEYLKLNPPTTIRHETVKSYGEMDIANFLTQNGIRYIYEHPYEFDTRTSTHGQYHPDFYLPDYNIYIEYFGINRKGEVPSYFTAENGMTASETYRASMEWKRTTHLANQTIMLECYAYEKMEGHLLSALKERLESASVPLAPLSPKELWAQVTAEGLSLLDSIIELFETLINLIKSNNYDIATVRTLNHAGIDTQANSMLLSLLEPIFDSYCQYLSEQDEIDFNDMINLASEYVRQGKYINPYKFVIVDEYQDMSKARFTLLDCLRKSSDYDLFCVGDDWQSIYRFAGSDIGFILNFSQYWGPSEISRIETTYRFSQQLISISSGFIMKNPMQLKKSIQGISEDYGFPLGEIYAYTDNNAVEFIVKRLKDLPLKSTVFFIGRYSFDINPLTESGLFSYQYANEKKAILLKIKSRPDLQIEFLTAHKSKGLQADYVFIINNKRSKMGFPSKIQDAPILNLLLDNCDQYPYAEERRLFYVALTRAKKKAFIVTLRGQESVFALELRERYHYELKREQFECPVCGGQLIKRSGPYGDFWGCSNYPTLGCTYKRKIY